MKQYFEFIESKKFLTLYGSDDPVIVKVYFEDESENISLW